MTAGACIGCRAALGYWHERICGACTVKRRDALCLRLRCYEILDDEEWEAGFCETHEPTSRYYAYTYADPGPADVSVNRGSLTALANGPRAWSLAWRRRWVQSQEGRETRG